MGRGNLPGTANLHGHSSAVKGVALSADGRLAVSASNDMTLKLWDLETGQELRTLQGHSGRVNGVALSKDGRLAVSASDDDTLKVWDLETGQELRTLQGHSNWVKGVALSADGRLAVSASYDHILALWDLETGEPWAIFFCDAMVLSCAFGDAGLIVAGDGSGAVHFLSLQL
jgi:WD40 repeat protein